MLCWSGHNRPTLPFYDSGTYFGRDIFGTGHVWSSLPLFKMLGHIWHGTYLAQGHGRDIFGRTYLVHMGHKWSGHVWPQKNLRTWLAGTCLGDIREIKVVNS